MKVIIRCKFFTWSFSASTFSLNAFISALWASTWSCSANNSIFFASISSFSSLFFLNSALIILANLCVVGGSNQAKKLQYSGEPYFAHLKNLLPRFNSIYEIRSGQGRSHPQKWVLPGIFEVLLLPTNPPLSIFTNPLYMNLLWQNLLSSNIHTCVGVGLRLELEEKRGY